jgi:hypothetical protein
VDWASAGPRLLGAGIIVFCVIFWAFTDRVEPLFVTTGGTLLAIGQGTEALIELRRPPEPPIGAGDTNSAGGG